jgi:hypothetical protein
MCEAPNKGCAKGVDLPTATEARGPNSKLGTPVFTLIGGTTGTLWEATEISQDSDPTKNLTFQGPTPAVQISAAVE